MNVRIRSWEVLVGALFGRGEADLGAVFERAAQAGPKCWTVLISIANANLVTAALWRGLCREGLSGFVPADAAAYLEGFSDFNRERNRAMRAQLLECLGALNRRGIVPMPIKGSAYLLDGLYEDIGDRFLGDLDILIPEERLTEAAQLMASLGYRPFEHFDHSRHHHLPPLVRSGDVAGVELHRAPVADYGQPALPTATFWASAAESVIEGLRYRSPAPSHAVLLSFLHAEVVDRNLSRFLIPLRPLLDVALLRARHDGRIDWREIRNRASIIGRESSLRRFLYVLGRVSGDRSESVSEGSEGSEGTMADAAHFEICRAAIAWPVVTRCVLRADRFSRRRIRDDHGIDGGVLAVYRRRLIELGLLMMSGIRG